MGFAPLFEPSLFDAAECGRIIALGAAAGLSPAGLVGGRKDGQQRRAGICWLPDDEAGWVLDRLMGAVARFNRTGFGFTLTEFAERMQLARYEAAESGHFDWHSDLGRGPLAEKRKLTLVVQLSDPEDYEGGRLEMNPDGTPVEAETARGTATCFPAFVLHRVTPVSRGTRWSLTTWVHGPAFV